MSGATDTTQCPRCGKEKEMENKRRVEIPCEGRTQGWVFQVESRLLGCGCVQEIIQITTPSVLSRTLEVRYWLAICEICFELGRHNFNRQPQSKWL